MRRCVWCYWQPSSYHRKDGAFAAQVHDQQGQPISTYWLAWPPFVEVGMEVVVVRKRFRTPEAAMRHADATWPVEDNL